MEPKYGDRERGPLTVFIPKIVMVPPAIFFNQHSRRQLRKFGRQVTGLAPALYRVVASVEGVQLALVFVLMGVALVMTGAIVIAAMIVAFKLLYVLAMFMWGWVVGLPC